MSWKASVEEALRAMKVRHKQARGGTRFFHRGYHRGYHGLPQRSAFGRDNVSALETAFQGTGLKVLARPGGGKIDRIYTRPVARELDELFYGTGSSPLWTGMRAALISLIVAFVSSTLFAEEERLLGQKCSRRFARKTAR